MVYAYLCIHCTVRVEHVTVRVEHMQVRRIHAFMGYSTECTVYGHTYTACIHCTVRVHSRCIDSRIPGYRVPAYI